MNATRSLWRRAAQIFMATAMLAGAVGLIGPAPSANAASDCVGSRSPSLSTAKVFFKEYCGTTWDPQSGNHKCDYSAGSWECYGSPGRFPGTYACAGRNDPTIHQTNIAKAKYHYAFVCKETWKGSSGSHMCGWSGKAEWKRNSGWVCWEYGT